MKRLIPEQRNRPMRAIARLARKPNQHAVPLTFAAHKFLIAGLGFMRPSVRGMGLPVTMAAPALQPSSQRPFLPIAGVNLPGATRSRFFIQVA